MQEVFRRAAAVAALGTLVAAGSAGAATQTDTSALEQATNVGALSSTPTGVARHLKKWQDIANANNGNRATGTSGHAASAQYVFDTLTAAGYQPRFQNFTAHVWGETADPLFARTAPTTQTYVNGTDYLTM